MRDGPPTAGAGSLLSGELRDAALSAALHVAERLRDPAAADRAAELARAQSQFPEFSRWYPPGVAQGNAGLAILWAYLDACLPGQGWDAVGKLHLERAVDGADLESTAGTGLFSGLSGLAFAGWQLSRGGTRYRRMLADLDRVIASETVALASRVRAAHGLSVGDFDVISGLSGIGAYLLCRRDEPPAAIALANVVDALEAQVLRGVEPPAWYTPAALLYDDSTRQMFPHGNLNCGLAHGLPGVLALLSLVRMSGPGDPRLDAAIAAAADWLSSNRLDDPWGVNWPTAVHLEAQGHGPDAVLRAGDPTCAPGGPSRSAWCYGAPGVARALWLAGQALACDRYRALAMAAIDAVFRRPIPARMIDSPTFCHGVAGLLAITLRFGADTGLPVFADAATRLAVQIVAAFDPDSLLGFRNVEYGSTLTDQPGLLDGAAGTALVLLSAATGVEPTWDRLFLLS